MEHAAAGHEPLPPSRPMSRALGAAVVMFLGALAAQLVFPGLALLLLYAFGPGLLGVLFASPNGSRETVAANGFTAAVAGGLAGATWIATHPGEMHPAAVVVSCVVSFLILAIGSGFVVYLLSRRFAGAGDPPRARRRPPFGTFEDDD